MFKYTKIESIKNGLDPFNKYTIVTINDRCAKMKITKLFALSFLALAASLFSVSLVSPSVGATCTREGLSIPKCDNLEEDGKQTGANNPIIIWIQFFIDLLSVIIVAGASVMIAFAGVQYMSSRDNPQTVQAAKQKIWNVIIGLIAYFFLYAFIQWLIPGGVF